MERHIPFIFGEHITKNKYTSAKWQTKNQSSYKVISFDNTPQEHPALIVTNFDDISQPTLQINIPHQNNNQIWKGYRNEMEMKTQYKTMYGSSFEQPTPHGKTDSHKK